MANISVSLPSDGDTIDVADYNTPITTIVEEINGGLDDSNIASDAAISGSKLGNDSVTSSKIDFTTFDDDTDWDSGWLSVSATGSFSGTLFYRKNGINQVYYRAAGVTGTFATGNTTITSFVIPSGYRPVANDVSGALFNGGVAGTVLVQSSDGQVVVSQNGSSRISTSFSGSYLIN